MALGLGLGVHKGQIVGDTCFGTLGETEYLLNIPNLVGWWDFSDVNQLYQSIDTSSAVTAAGQNIRRVNNKAQNNERLGTDSHPWIGATITTITSSHVLINETSSFVIIIDSNSVS